jgi:hypothetical protein
MSDLVEAAYITAAGGIAVAFLSQVVAPIVSDWRAAKKARIEKRTELREQAAVELIDVDAKTIQQLRVELTQAYDLLEKSERNSLHWQKEASRWYERVLYWQGQAEGNARGIRRRPPL